MNTKKLVASTIALTLIGNWILSKPTIAAPSTALEKAMQQTLPENFLDNQDIRDRTEYFVTEIDLNGDGVKEAIAVVVTPMCGVKECSAYVYKKSGSNYQTIGRFAVKSDNAAIGILKSKSQGWNDLVAEIYTRSPQETPWRLTRFDGSKYEMTFKQSRSPSQVLLKIKRGSGTKFK